MVVNEKAAADPIGGASRGAYARPAGLMYLVVLGFDIAGVIIASRIAGSGSFVETANRIIDSEQLFRIGICCGLVGALSTIPLAVALYVTVKPVDGNLAMTALLFRVVEAATGAAAIVVGFVILQIDLAAARSNAFDANQLGALADLFSHAPGTNVSAIFFSLGSTLFFYLFLRSRSIPRLLAAWGIFASAVYATAWFVTLILPQFSSIALGLGSGPILIAELATAMWLLIRGIK